MRHCPPQSTFGHCPSQGYSFYPTEASIEHSPSGFVSTQLATPTRAISPHYHQVYSDLSRGESFNRWTFQSGWRTQIAHSETVIIHSSVLHSNRHRVIPIFRMSFIRKTQTISMYKTHFATTKIKITTPHTYQNIYHLTRQNQSGDTSTGSSSNMQKTNIGLHKNVSPI